MASAVRVLLGFAVVSTGFLSGSFQLAGAQSTGEVAQAAEEETEASTSPADAYGVRYATRKLVMPKGMIRGTFDVVIGKLPDSDSSAFQFGSTVETFSLLTPGS